MNAVNDAFWMPFTANRQYRARPRMFFEAAAGMYYTEPGGRRVLDGTAGLWCVAAGHGRTEIAAAIGRQALELDFAPAFQTGHPLPFRLCARLADLAPPGLRHVFLTNSGSEAVDTALKIALAYHRARGDGQRLRMIGRERAYHGVNLGGLSVSGIGRNRRQFPLLLPGVDHLRHTHSLADMAFSRGQPTWGAHFADDLLRLIELHDASTIAAVIVEPVSGASGVLVPPVGYLERLREICTEHGILLVFDEVVTGFGRLGTPFAAHRFGVTPDMIVFAKAVTNATVPLGGVIASAAVYSAINDGTAKGIEFFHGYTYSGHPVACAAGVAALDVYATEDLFGRVARMEPEWETRLHSLADTPFVVDVRNLGLLGAIQLSAGGRAPGERGAAVQAYCYDAGVFVRVVGDTIVLSPPFIIELHEIERIVDAIGRAIRCT